MAFSFSSGLLGGILIGSSVMFHAKVLGRVTGMSGMLRKVSNVVPYFSSSETSTTQPDNKEKEETFPTLEWYYIVGLLVGGGILAWVPQFKSLAFHSEPVMKTSFTKSIIGGLLLGIGTSYGCGCTSGHMICGLARLSKRSIVATATFCGVAFLTVNLGKTLDHDLLDNAVTRLNQSHLIEPQIGTMVAFAGALLGGYGIIYQIANFQRKKEKKYQTIKHLISFYNGLVFAIGLGFAGMTKPDRVQGFFNMLYSPKYYDATLFMVAGFAVMPALLFFQSHVLKEIDQGKKPVCEKDYCFPTSTQITAQLVIGSALFGLTWGLTGVCPGPLLVNMANTSAYPQVLTMLGSTIVGMNAFSFAKRYIH